MKCYLCTEYKEKDIGGTIFVFCGLSERSAKLRKIVNGECNSFKRDSYKKANCENCKNFDKLKDYCQFIPRFEDNKCVEFKTLDEQIKLF